MTCTADSTTTRATTRPTLTPCCSGPGMRVRARRADARACRACARLRLHLPPAHKGQNGCWGIVSPLRSQAHVLYVDALLVASHPHFFFACAGVEKLIITAGSLAEARRALALARTHGAAPGRWHPVPVRPLLPALQGPLSFERPCAPPPCQTLPNPALVGMAPCRAAVLHSGGAPHPLRRIPAAP